MEQYYLGLDIGATKTYALVADARGYVVGVGKAGPGNHETVGYDGLALAIQQSSHMALVAAGISKEQITAAGFGVAGYDWPTERADTLAAISTLGLQAPVEAVNDTILGLLAGSEAGWGIAIVSGTGCNCRGWDQRRQKEGMVTGASLYMGEGAGSSELIAMAVRALAYEWSLRGPKTLLTLALVRYAGAQDLADLLEGLVNERYSLAADAAPLVFEAAAAGDAVAADLIHWAGCELGELGKAVIRQIDIQDLEFDIVLTGSMFNGGAMLIEPMQASIKALAPGARFLRLSVPPAIGSVLLAMDVVRANSAEVRRNLTASFPSKA